MEFILFLHFTLNALRLTSFLFFILHLYITSYFLFLTSYLSVSLRACCKQAWQSHLFFLFPIYSLLLFPLIHSSFLNLNLSFCQYSISSSSILHSPSFRWQLEAHIFFLELLAAILPNPFILPIQEEILSLWRIFF